MHKVTTINLNGRAYQLEEDGYHRLQKYLQNASAALRDDPDKDDVLADIEQAVADRAERLLKHGKNVVTAEQITAILQQMGDVETEPSDKASAKAADSASPRKRLFTIREGAVLLGVCRGIAAYMGIDVNIVRVCFVLLTVVTHGFGILAYVLLGIFLPQARTDEELAEAYGRPVRAQEILARVRERATDPETIRTLSGNTERIVRLVLRLVGAFVAALFAILTFAWLWVMWQWAFNRLQLYDQLRGLNGWRQAVAITAVYLAIGLPLLLIFRWFDRIGEYRRQTRVGSVVEAILAVLWGVAVMGVVICCTTYAGNVRDYLNSHQGKLDIGGSHICIDDSMCADGRTPFYANPD